MAALTGRFAELDKSARNAVEQSRTGLARLEGELSSLRTDATRLAQRFDTLKGEIDERLKGAAKSSELASLEREVQTFRKSEAERSASANANATQMLLGLELTISSVPSSVATAMSRS